jgi:hypothetical protein
MARHRNSLHTVHHTLVSTSHQRISRLLVMTMVSRHILDGVVHITMPISRSNLRHIHSHRTMPLGLTLRTRATITGLNKSSCGCCNYLFVSFPLDLTIEEYIIWRTAYESLGGVISG